MSLYTKIIDIQKLTMAWDKVRKNKPASGIDNVTWEMYEERKKENIKQLNIELVNHEYEPMPVKIVTIYKGEKARKIALYSMRDKNVQQAVASELVRIYDSNLSNSAYAYRPNKSALVALDKIEDIVKEGDVKCFLKMDITNFFDTIDVKLLKSRLIKDIKETDVIDLIEHDCMAPQLSDFGELISKEKGVYQGSALAPVLSNIYMMEFDKESAFEGASDNIMLILKNCNLMRYLCQKAKNTGYLSHFE
jgi:retron-type reverse transcriptase